MTKETKDFIKFCAIALIIGAVLSIGNVMLIESGYFDSGFTYEILRGY